MTTTTDMIHELASWVDAEGKPLIEGLRKPCELCDGYKKVETHWGEDEEDCPECNEYGYEYVSPDSAAMRCLEWQMRAVGAVWLSDDAGGILVERIFKTTLSWMERLGPERGWVKA